MVNFDSMFLFLQNNYSKSAVQVIVIANPGPDPGTGVDLGDFTSQKHSRGIFALKPPQGFRVLLNWFSEAIKYFSWSLFSDQIDLILGNIF